MASAADYKAFDVKLDGLMEKDPEFARNIKAQVARLLLIESQVQRAAVIAGLADNDVTSYASKLGVNNKDFAKAAFEKYMSKATALADVPFNPNLEEKFAYGEWLQIAAEAAKDELAKTPADKATDKNKNIIVDGYHGERLTAFTSFNGKGASGFGFSTQGLTTTVAGQTITSVASAGFDRDMNATNVGVGIKASSAPIYTGIGRLIPIYGGNLNADISAKAKSNLAENLSGSGYIGAALQQGNNYNTTQIATMALDSNLNLSLDGTVAATVQQSDGALSNGKRIWQIDANAHGGVMFPLNGKPDMFGNKQGISGHAGLGFNGVYNTQNAGAIRGDISANVSDIGGKNDKGVFVSVSIEPAAVIAGMFKGHER